MFGGDQFPPFVRMQIALPLVVVCEVGTGGAI